jgi:hypothetical protein
LWGLDNSIIAAVTHWTIPRAALVAGLVTVAVAAAPAPAAADLTIFLGTTSSPSGQPHRGVSTGFTIVAVGIEFEYYHAGEDLPAGVPSLNLGSANVVFQAPTGRFKFYGTVGVGVYYETLGEYSRTNTSGNVGGGLKVVIAGPLGVRLDYRAITLRDSLRDATEQRWYAGAYLNF